MVMQNIVRSACVAFKPMEKEKSFPVGWNYRYTLPYATMFNCAGANKCEVGESLHS